MITSKSNELIKYLRNLHEKKYRDEYSEYIIEGVKMFKEAVDEKLNIKKVIVCEEIFSEELPKGNYDIEYVSKNVFEYISDTKTPQGILAIIKKKENDNKEYSDVIFALDTLQDPGNLGTIIRTLDSAGIKTLLLSEECVDPYNLKVVRSTMGAIYRLDIFENIKLIEEISNLKKKGYKVIVTAIDAKENLFEYNFPKKIIIVIGNESNGVSKEIQELADEKIKIPMIRKNRKS